MTGIALVLAVVFIGIVLFSIETIPLEVTALAIVPVGLADGGARPVRQGGVGRREKNDPEKRQETPRGPDR